MNICENGNVSFVSLEGEKFLVNLITVDASKMILRRITQ